METRISKKEISSFVGDVLPIWLISDKRLKFEPIRWSLSGDAVTMKRFGGCSHGAFNYGVLITFVKEGEAVVTASYEGVEYTCRITSRARREYSSDEPMNYYLGDFHAHTTHEHIHDKFLESNEQSQKKYVDYIKREALRDVAVITDHSETIDLENFFRGFTETELAGDMHTVIYPGSESEIMYEEADRFGHFHRVSGEYIMLNSNAFCQAETYPEFFKAFRFTPYPIGIFAHPHIVGISTSGVWDFKPRYQYNAEFRRFTKYVEIVNCPSESISMIHEYAYSDALDAGLRVSTTCGSDLHGDWDYTSYEGKTVIMAPEKTREAFTDSLLNLRAYACESQNLKLRYSVNGKYAPADLPLAEKYDFRVSVGYFKEDESTVPVRCDVISDGGATLLTVTDVDFSDFSFSIDSNSARWFYLRFVDSKGRRTWSPPVFTGREYDVYTNDGLIPIDSGEYTLCDKDGCAVPALSDGNVHTNATFDEGACELIFDFGRARSVAALGNYAPLIDIQKLRAEGISPVMPTSSFAVDYEISTSLDGESWEICKTGLFRAFAGEDIVRFAKRDARMVKLKINSTTGKRYGKKPYSDMPLVIAELSLFSEE